MSLEKVQHIEGLDSFQDHELFDDTPPGSVLVEFHVKSVDQPALTAKEKRIIRRNVLYVKKIWHGGMSSSDCPVKDEVDYDDQSKKWVIRKLCPKLQSDIGRFPNEWNAFYRGNSDNVVGTPLSLLFKNDPSKVQHYGSFHITVIEQLAAQTYSDAQRLGMGANEDIERAKKYIERAEINAPAAEMNFKLEQMAQEKASMQRQIEDLTSKLTEVLEHQLKGTKPAAKRGRPAKLKEVDSTKIEGVA